ncbi:MAG: ABC transporter substrate-binding protein [Spirochaetales bacterium]|nr:ABC transporter substrate-binding protein [Spirochaetales bacterium]
MKHIKILFLTLMVTLATMAWANGEADKENISSQSPKIIVPTGATLASVALYDGPEAEIEVIKSADLLASRIISGEADFAVIPSNLAAILSAKGADVRMAGPVIWGLLYVVVPGEEEGWNALKGQDVSMIGRGLSPDILLRHLATENGLIPGEDFTLNYVTSATELAPAFIAGKSGASMMPEPMLTAVMSKKPQTTVALDLQEEWTKLYGFSYPQASLVVSSRFAEDHPETTQEVVAAISEALEQANARPQDAGAAIASLAPELNANLMSQAIPRVNLRFVPAAQAREALDAYYQVLFDFDAKTVGGSLPNDAFYLP